MRNKAYYREPPPGTEPFPLTVVIVWALCFGAVLGLACFYVKANATEIGYWYTDLRHQIVAFFSPVGR